AGGYRASCPAHHDRIPSLSVSEGDDGRVLLCCHAGCTFEQVVEALSLQPIDLFASDSAKAVPRCPREGATVQQSPGCNLEDYAAAKGLALKFLEFAGLSTTTHGGAQAVRIPYFDEFGSELGIRMRTALAGADRFRWKSGSKPHLYGLNRMDDARR